MAEFRFKQFVVDDGDCAMKVGTDSVLLGAWTDVDSASTVLDLGAGSGLLALMVAQRVMETDLRLGSARLGLGGGPSPARPALSARIHAVEIDRKAAEAARHNFEASPWSDRLSVSCADALAYIPEWPVDLIISNPPYFTSTLRSPDPRRAAARHCEGSFGPLALLSLAAKWLSPTGSLAMITPTGDMSGRGRPSSQSSDDGDVVTFEAAMQRLNIRRKCLVSTVAGRAPTRILWQISRQPGPCRLSSMAVRNPDGSYTPEYTALTRPFYLNL